MAGPLNSFTSPYVIRVANIHHFAWVLCWFSWFSFLLNAYLIINGIVYYYIEINMYTCNYLVYSLILWYLVRNWFPSETLSGGGGGGGGSPTWDLKDNYVLGEWDKRVETAQPGDQTTYSWHRDARLPPMQTMELTLWSHYQCGHRVDSMATLVVYP